MYSNYFYDYGFLYGLIGTYFVVIMLCVIFALVTRILLFKKLGESWWKAIVPFYESYVQYAKFWGNGWLFLVPFALAILSAVPIIGFVFVIANVVFYCVNKYKIAEAFGEGIGFTIGLVLLPIVFFPILAFDKKHEYLGVPLDGFSYKDIKRKYEDVKAKDEALTASRTYEEAPTEIKKDIKFEQPSKPEVEEVEVVETKTEK